MGGNTTLVTRTHIMLWNWLRKLWPQVQFTCNAPQWVAEEWPRLLRDASLIVREHKLEGSAEASGEIACGPYDAIAHLTRRPPTDGGTTQVLVSGGSTARVVVRVLLYHGCTIDPSLAPSIGHSLFACQLGPALLQLLRDFGWLVLPDGKEESLEADLEPIMEAQLDRLLAKRKSGEQRFFISVGSVGEANRYCAFHAGSLSLEQWRCSSAYHDIRQAWTAAGFTELPIFDRSEE